MKPLNLKLKNIGAFAGETEIDFSRLNDIFLICGKTGSGKTTILDSICYALYGKLPGARSDHPRMMRSQFVGEDEDSSIVFEFMLGGEKYKIARVLPLSYVNRNNKVSEKQETVALFKYEQGRYAEIAGKKSETAPLFRNDGPLLHCRDKRRRDSRSPAGYSMKSRAE